MFSKFLGKGDKTDAPQTQDAVDSRGLEVIEDDPETVWSMWDDALAQQESRFGALEAVKSEEAAAAEKAALLAQTPYTDVPTQPMGLEEMSVERRKNNALEVVEMHHHRIANTIRTLWGYKECGTYINKLIMNGGDGMGHARVGFNQEAVVAMMELSNLHEAESGPNDIGTFSFTDQSK